jgi:dipeptidyl aminopeptidase/acylaminoacyl peptidase
MIPRALLFGNPTRGGTSISPDGKWLAWSASSNGVMNLWVAPRDGSVAPRQLTFDQRRGVPGHRWTRDSTRLLFSQDTDGDEYYRLYAIDVATGEQRCLSPQERASTRVVSASRKHPGVILVEIKARDPRYGDLFTVDLASGERTLLLENPGFPSFIVDDDYAVHYAIGPTPAGGRQLHAKDDAGIWKVISVIEPDDVRTSTWYHLSADNTTLYGIDSRGRDKGALVAIDVRSGAMTVVAEDACADIGGMLTDPDTFRPVACWVTWQRSAVKVLCESVRADVAFLEARFHGQWSLSSRTDDNRIWLVSTSSDTAPPTTYLYDRDRLALETLVVHKPELAGVSLVRMQSTVITSRDGLPLVSYLTIPRAVDGGGALEAKAPVPLVLFVHGGPWSREGFGLNSMHQWLADRGYAVLSVNFRGSTGFGKAFVNAADGQWGLRMSDDLEDAVDWAIAAGVADPRRIAIVGGSYGGFAVLSALTQYPGRYACGVDIFGPADLQTLLADIPPHWEHERKMLYRSVGDPTTPEGLAKLQAVSPIHRAHAIVDPLLIAQGANDRRVKQSESDRMVDRLVERSIPVTYVLFPDEGHGFAREPNRLVFNAMMEAFLAKHLGGQLEPFELSDFPGNSMQVVHDA